MTGKERITRILNNQPVDRIGVYEHIWSDAFIRWFNEGHIKPGDLFEDVFGYDMLDFGLINYDLDLDYIPQTIAEDEETVTMKDRNYATMRRHKLHDATPEHIGYDIVDRESWDKVKHLLTPDRRRMNFEGYRDTKKRCADKGLFFACSNLNVFECIHPVIGHENMLVAMALDPEWIKDMADTYADLMIKCWDIAFAEEGQPDGMWFFEDMGFKEHPFMSPEMYRELIMPAHKKTFDYAHDRGMKVIMHSCGFIEPLLPDVFEAGVDCLEAMEVKAGMDLVRIYNNFGKNHSFMGGFDVRTLSSNDREKIDQELYAKIPIVMQNNGYVLHSDHSIPGNVDFETMKYFIEKAKEIGTYHDFKE